MTETPKPVKMVGVVRAARQPCVPMPTDNSRNEHAASYFAATANTRPCHPELTEALRADVCIVGAGFTGVSAALTLAERGYAVIVLEANRVGWGASGRSGGQVIGGFSGDAGLAARSDAQLADLVWDMGWHGHRLIYERIARYGIDCDLKFGYVEVATRPRHMRGLVAGYRELQRRSFPYPFRMLDRDAVRDLLGTDAYCGGLFNGRNGHLHPLNLCLGEARAGEQLGVAFFEHSPVLRIRPGDPVQVITDKGSVSADAVLLAGNAYHALFGRHFSGRAFSASSFQMATEPLPGDLAARINPQDVAVCDSNYVLDYFRLSADRRLLFGGRSRYARTVPGSIRALLRPRMLRVYPQLADVGIDYEWEGKFAVTIRRLPMLGRIGTNIYYAQAYGGHGVNFTHVAGEIAADAMRGSLERMDVFARIRHPRLPFGRWLNSQLVALGVAWYRLRDLM